MLSTNVPFLPFQMSSNLSKFSILFTKSNHTDEAVVQILPTGDAHTYSVKFVLKESAVAGQDTGPAENLCTESWICPRANIHQYVRNCVVIVTKDVSAQRFTHMELQIPMFPTCLVDVRGSSVDQILAIAFEHLDLISADGMVWPTRQYTPEPESTPN